MRTTNTQQTGLMKRKGIVFSALLIVAAIVILSSVAQTLGQSSPGTDAAQETAAAAGNDLLASGLQSLSVWSIIRMTDWLFWPFVLLTVSGILILTYRSLVEYQDKSRSELLFMKLVQMRDLRSLMDGIASSPGNRASRMFYRIVSTFYKTGKAEPIRDEAHQFLNSERNSFETFNRVIYFLSDTAGALGLLGTVWGIFATFHGGKLDGPTILQGMSISLVTTLVGLIISTVLNMGATGVFALFNKQMKILASQAEDIRQALLSLEKSVVSANNNGQAQPQYAPPSQATQQVKPQNQERPEYDINRQESAHYEGQSPEAAQDEIRQQAGPQFEPQQQEPPHHQPRQRVSLLGDLMDHLPENNESQHQEPAFYERQQPGSPPNNPTYQAPPQDEGGNKQSFFKPQQPVSPQSQFEPKYQRPAQNEPPQASRSYFEPQHSAASQNDFRQPPPGQHEPKQQSFFDPQKSALQNEPKHQMPPHAQQQEQMFFKPTQPETDQNESGNRESREDQPEPEEKIHIVESNGWKQNGNGFGNI